MNKFPITPSAVIGVKAKQFDDKGEQISYSTLANEVSEETKGRNPDFFESDGKSVEEQQEVGKGANPTADIVTKNVTTIDAVFREPSPVADGVTLLADVPASLPLNAPIAGPTGKEHLIGKDRENGTTQKYVDGVLKPAETVKAKIVDGEPEAGTVVTKQAEVVYGAEAAKLTAEKEAEVTKPKAKPVAKK